MAKIEKKDELKIPIVKENIVEDYMVADFNKEDYMIEKEVELKNGQLAKIKDYKKEYRVKGSIARGRLRAAESLNIPLDHLDKVATELNNRKIDNIFINDLIGRYGFYNGQIMSRADLARKINTSMYTVEISINKFKDIIKHKDFKGAYIEYLGLIKAEKNKAEKDELNGGSI